MADLVITAANVVAGENSVSRNGRAAEAAVAGKVVYLNSTSKKWALADNNAATAEAREAVGIALNAASLNQPIDVHTEGDITIGATLVPGTEYYLSDTPGGICARADLASGEYICFLGIAVSASVLRVDIQYPNVAL